MRSPLASDGDTVSLVEELQPDLVVLVADAGFGTINDVRLSMEALDRGAHAAAIIVFLNRYDGADELHRRNRAWLVDRSSLDVLTTVLDLSGTRAVRAGGIIWGMNVACTQCGTPSPPGNRFCGQCGSPLPPSPGNLPPSARPTYAPLAAPLPPGAVSAGGALDPLLAVRHGGRPAPPAACPMCGATLAAPTVAPAAVGSIAGSPVGFGHPDGAASDPRSRGRATATVRGRPVRPSLARRREPLVSGAMLTVIVAIVIVLALAVAASSPGRRSAGDRIPARLARSTQPALGPRR